MKNVKIMNYSKFSIIKMTRNRKVNYLILLLFLILIYIVIAENIFCLSCFYSNYVYAKGEKISTPSNFKVAFIGDQGLNNYSRAVLQMIKNEEAEIVLHQGDFDYLENTDEWDKQINDILGPDFPYFASIGNHDIGEWKNYQQKLQSRLNRVKGAVCTGNLGVKSACTYKGLFFILSGVGTKGFAHHMFIRDKLSSNNFIWRICSWHKNQRLMQVGDKKDEVGWKAYEECRRGGAIIATAHEHSYSRTYLIDNFRNQSIASASNTLRIRRGKTFAFVSALGGHSIRNQNGTLAANDWWASVYTSKQGANYGALFCVFNQNGIKNKAHCYFKDIDGRVPDEFDVISN